MQKSIAPDQHIRSHMWWRYGGQHHCNHRCAYRSLSSHPNAMPFSIRFKLYQHNIEMQWQWKWNNTESNFMCFKQLCQMQRLRLCRDMANDIHSDTAKLFSGRLN